MRMANTSDIARPAFCRVFLGAFANVEVRERNSESVPQLCWAVRRAQRPFESPWVHRRDRVVGEVPPAAPRRAGSRAPQPAGGMVRLSPLTRFQAHWICPCECWGSLVSRRAVARSTPASTSAWTAARHSWCAATLAAKRARLNAQRAMPAPAAPIWGSVRKRWIDSQIPGACWAYLAARRACNW